MSKCIDCEWKKDKIVTINPDGQVWPCCYLQNFNYHMQVIKDEESHFEGNKKKNKWIFKEYYDNKDELNIFKKPLKEILQHKWFTETLPNSWKDYENTTLTQCRTHCTKEKKDD